MVEFGGWRMPLSYNGILREVLSVRKAVGLFDVSHMARLYLRGVQAETFLQSITTNNLLILQNLQGQYTLLCNEAGGVVDDAILYRIDNETFFLVVNAANRDKDIFWMSQHLPDGVVIDDITETTSMFAMQGPKSVDVFNLMGIGGATELRRLAFSFTEWEGISLAMARSGYTGEDGFEIACCNDDAESLWKGITVAGSDFGMAKCGLASRDILRIEAGYPLYGHEVNDDITPVVAGLMRFVKMDKGDFVGRSAIMKALESPPHLSRIGVVMEERAVPRSGDVITGEGVRIGEITSGTWSPTLDRGIGIAYVCADVAAPGKSVDVMMRGKTNHGNLTALPFYERGR